MSEAHAAHAEHGDVKIDTSFHPHVCTAGAFFKVYVALLFLTVITVGVAQFDFGEFNMLIAMAIASVKAALVMAIFMHLRWDTPINNIAFIGSLVFLALLFLFTLADFATRADADPAMNRPAEVANPFVWQPKNAVLPITPK